MNNAAYKKSIETSPETGIPITDNKRFPIKRIMLTSFYLLFSYTFTVVVGGNIFANNAADYSPAIPLLLIAFELALLLLVYRVLGKHAVFVKRYYALIIASGLFLLLTVNIIMGYVLRYEPIFDLNAIFTGAKEWATTGTFVQYTNPTFDPNYFYSFPNNLGGMSILFLAFKAASLFGATDYFAIAMITNACLAIATVLFTVLICKRLFGITQSVMALIFILLSPPFYLIAPVFYTDSLSMVFPVLIVYLYLKYNDCETNAKKVLIASLIGFFGAIGILVKFTVIIALIAIIIYNMFTKGIVSSLRIAMMAGIVTAAVIVAFNAYIYSAHLNDKDAAERLKTPYTHWIMMSLDNGYYNPQDYDFTRSFTDKNEQQEAILNRIKQRIEEKGALGMLHLFYWKGIVTFGDSTYDLSFFLNDYPVNDTAFNDIVIDNGKYYRQYKYVCFGTYFTLQLLMLISAYGVLLNKRNPWENMIPLLCVFGTMSFFMLWEVSGRYVTNYIPMIIIAAVSGFSMLSEVFREKKLTMGNLSRRKVSMDNHAHVA